MLSEKLEAKHAIFKQQQSFITQLICEPGQVTIENQFT